LFSPIVAVESDSKPEINAFSSSVAEVTPGIASSASRILGNTVATRSGAFPLIVGSSLKSTKP
jgi:hypothetical protein